MDRPKSLDNQNYRKRMLLDLERRVKVLKRQRNPRPRNEIDRLEDIMRCIRLCKKEKQSRNKHLWSNVFPFKQFANLGVIPRATRQSSKRIENPAVQVQSSEGIPIPIPNVDKILIEEVSPEQKWTPRGVNGKPVQKETHVHVTASQVKNATSLISALNSQAPLLPVKIFVSFTGDDRNNNSVVESATDSTNNNDVEESDSANNFASLFLSFNQFGESLESLELDLEKLNANTSSSPNEFDCDQLWILDINLPKLKNLFIKDHRGPWGFLLCLPALENLRLLKGHVECFHQEKVVQLAWHRGAMCESNLWKYLPKLRTLQIERVKDPNVVESLVPHSNMEFTRSDYSISRIIRTFNPKVTFWDMVRPDGGRRWWRFWKN